MGVIGGQLGYSLLRRICSRRQTGERPEAAYQGKNKLEALFGKGIWNAIAGKSVVDFGCGTGREAVDLALQGASHVVGIDIRDNVLEKAQQNAEFAGVSHKCVFTRTSTSKADFVFSIDAFEHFDDPGDILQLMSQLLASSSAEAWISFGPTWYHPLGGHTFSVFPWAHLLFTEQALIRWRSDFKSDGATRFSEVEGGLNQMSIRRFVRLVNASPLMFKEVKLVPIRGIRLLTNPLTREFFTSIVQAKLTLRS